MISRLWSVRLEACRDGAVNLRPAAMRVVTLDRTSRSSVGGQREELDELVRDGDRVENLARVGPPSLTRLGRALGLR